MGQAGARGARGAHLARGADQRAQQRQRQPLLGAVEREVVAGRRGGQDQRDLVGGDLVRVERAGERQRGGQRAAGRGAGAGAGEEHKNAGS